MKNKALYRILLIKKDGKTIELLCTEDRKLAEDYFEGYSIDRSEDERIIKEAYITTHFHERIF